MNSWHETDESKQLRRALQHRNRDDKFHDRLQAVYGSLCGASGMLMVALIVDWFNSGYDLGSLWSFVVVVLIALMVAAMLVERWHSNFCPQPIAVQTRGVREDRRHARRRRRGER